jgi:hypothetical protein
VEQFQSANDTKKILLDESDPSKFVIIGTGLSAKYESELTSFLRENRDIFAWSPKDMPGVPRELAEHSLHVRPDAKPAKQPLRRFTEEKRRERPLVRRSHGSLQPASSWKCSTLTGWRTQSWS